MKNFNNYDIRVQRFFEKAKKSYLKEGWFLGTACKYAIEDTEKYIKRNKKEILNEIQ